MKTKFIVCLVSSVAVIALLTGCVEEENGVKELRISNIVFCSEQPLGYMNYEEQPDATYLPGDMVWIYMNIENHKYNPNPDGTNEIWLTEDITLIDPSGEVIASGEIYNDHRNYGEDRDPEDVYMHNYINTTSDWDIGKYTVKIDITDKLGDTTASASTSFWLSL